MSHDERARREIEDDVYRQELFARLISVRVKNGCYSKIPPGSRGWTIGGWDTEHIYTIIDGKCAQTSSWRLSVDKK